MTENQIKGFTDRIGKANKTEMIVVVYDISLAYLKDAKENFVDKDTFFKSVDGAKKCVADLIDSLNFDYEISYNLLQLYTYVNRQLLLAKLNEEEKNINNAEKVISSLRETFAEVAKMDKSPAMVENAQHVEVGMTYGRGVLNESVVNAGQTFSV